MAPKLTIESPLRSRERILTFGVQGTGKSNSLLSIARKVPNQHFHIVDNDVSPSYNRALDTEFTDLQNVTVYETDPDDWADALSVVQKIGPTVEYHDWLGFDSMSLPWGAVQSWFIEKLHGEDEADYFMRVREEALAFNEKASKSTQLKEKKTLGALDGWMDWPAINKQYFKLTKELFRVKGHLYLTAEQDKNGDQDDDEVKKLFGPYGVKPKGQKRLGYMPQTVLLMTKRRAGDYHLTTVKDRNRAELEDVVYVDFAKDYLVKVAGWKMGVVK